MAFAVVGSIGAILNLAVLAYFLPIISGVTAENYYPFIAQALFLLAGLGLAAILGLAGGIMSRTNGRRGGAILVVAAVASLVSPIPYYAATTYTYQIPFFNYIEAVFLSPTGWWFVLFLAGGFFAFRNSTPAKTSCETNTGQGL